MTQVRGHRPNLTAPKLRQMSIVETAWMGAMVEADGHVTIVRSLGKNHVMPSVHVAVTNADPEIMSACLRVTGTGSVFRKKPPTNLRETKPCYRWNIQAWLDALGFLRRIRPYSMKAQQALNDLGSLFGAPV